MSLIHIEKRLRSWAVWSINIDAGRVGYPSRSSIDCLWEGSMQPRYSKPPFPMNYLDAQAMNCWINIMGTKHRDYYEAIKVYYLTKYRIWEIAQYAGISPRAFKQRLHDAKIFLDGCLTVFVK